MAGINTGILHNAYPLSATKIAELERDILENSKAYAYLDENSKLCFAMPSFEPGNIKDLAWNNAYGLTNENGVLVKRAYKKTSLNTYTLYNTYTKHTISGTWQQQGGAEPTALEGSGQEYYTTAPSVLSFRSTAPLDEFQGVQVNGQIVDPSNYELEEGSTIVKLSTDFLKTLDIGTHEISVVSNSQTATGDFTVAAPELNEYGFYYNHPYSVNFYGEEDGISFYGPIMLKADHTTAFFGPNESGYDRIGDWSIDNGICTINIDSETTDSTIFIGSFSADGTAFIGSETVVKRYNDAGSGLFGKGDGTFERISYPGVTFTLDSDHFASDNTYIYILNEEAGYWSFLPKDTTVGSYPPVKDEINNILVREIRHGAFSGNDVLESIDFLPRYLTNIDGCAFSGCSSVKSIAIPDGVVSIGYSAFSSCSSFTDLVIPDSVTSMGESVFSYCTSLTNLTLGSGLTAIPQYGFGNGNLKSITIPNTITQLGQYSLYNNRSLTNIVFAGTKAQWNAVIKGYGWNYNVPATNVQCTDGQVTL